MSRFLGWAWIPLIATLAWFATIAALLILWATHDVPHYKQTEANIVYISDVGAKYKTIFIVGTSVTSGFFLLSLFTDFVLRRRHRLATQTRTREVVYAVLSMCFGILACIALVGLSIFDAFNHSTVHWTLTLIFMVTLSISAIFTSAEIRLLRNDHSNKLALSHSFVVKAILLSIAIVAVVAMIVLMEICPETDWRGTADERKCNYEQSTSAVCEWVVAFIFVGYLATLTADVRQSVYTSPGHHNGIYRGDSTRTMPVGSRPGENYC
ncbi:hypothetical protein HKX48_009198 [Thoreauomyces humboldtii]|nr:hypothetical protein HKX48_009198 [Thoreauomyces humboldtii]